MTTIDDTTPLHLQGNGKPVTEELTLTDLRVTGTIPTELDGRYVRNGANPLTGLSDHPFFGDGMVHGVRLRDGAAEWYRNRYVRTPFIENPATDILDPAVMMDMTASKANTHVFGHAGRILALEEGHFPYVLDGDLDTVGPLDFGGMLAGSFTAHPKVCPETGEMLAFGYSAFEPYLRYLRVSADGQLVQTEEITVGGPTMMHDFNVTRNNVVFMDLPAVFDLEMAMRGEMPIRWDDDYPARLGVMPRTGSDADVTWYEIEPGYVFHPMNSYEDGDTIVLDVARLSHIWRDSMMDFPPPELWRWTIDTTTGKVKEEQIDDRPAEFPRVADSVVGLKHRFGYMMGIPDNPDYTDPANQTGAIIKYDRETGERTEHVLGRGRLPGEPVFVPADGGTSEDDGYLMTFVYEADTDSSSFIVLDASTMDQTPVASIELPRIPFGFHGNWIDSSVAGRGMTITEPDTWNSPYLQGVFAPVTEERDDTALKVVGEIPAALNGMFVRTGPNQQFAPMGAYHPFDGDGMLHAVYIEDGAARYRNRWIESKGLLAERARGRACYGGMTNFSFPDDDVMQEGGMMKNTANTATVRHAGRYFSMVEGSLPTEFDTGLRTLGEYDFGGRLDGPFTAHPKVDPVSGEMIFFGYSPMAPYLRYHEVDASGQLVHSADIDLPAGVMMHDFAITERYAVFFDAPAAFNMDALSTGEPMVSWRPENGTRIGIMPRRGTSSDIRWFEIPNCFVVHFSNAWDDGDKIEIRAPRMEDMPDAFGADTGGARLPMPWRWELDLATGSVTDEQTDDVPGEFPRINETMIGRRNRFGYDGTARGWDTNFDFNGVMQYDYERGTSAHYTYGTTQVSGEHIFAADPDGTAENDGWLMTFVTDAETEKSELAIIDARDVAAGPVARVQMAARVPIGFHANWFAAD